MIVFRDKVTGLTVGCNYKVMYSFLTEAGLEKLDRAVNKADYLITRNPYDRVVSLFFNKLRDVRPPTQWCQKEVMAFYGLEGQQELESVSFIEFVFALPDLKEDHFLPQTHGNPQFTFAVPMENLAVLKVALPHIDFTKKANASGRGPTDSYHTAATRLVVRDVYANDFKQLNYPL